MVESSWNVMAHGDAREGKWKGNWRFEWVASTLLTPSEHGVSNITTADAHTSAASSLITFLPHHVLNPKMSKRICDTRSLTQQNIVNVYKTFLLAQPEDGSIETNRSMVLWHMWNIF